MSDPKNDGEPAWELAETDPEHFFGLPEEYDAKTLKRAYTRMIKVYKPEKQPDKFKIIRGAYEILADLLEGDRRRARSGGNWMAMEMERFEQGAAVSESETSPAEDQAGDNQAAETLDDFLDDPQQAYSRLLARSNKTATDYYHLAILSDVCEHEMRMEHWLLQGLAAFPGDRRLGRLFHVWCGMPGDDALLADFLPQMAEKLAAGPFLRFSEPLWVRLTVLMSFEEWRRLMDVCMHFYRRSGIYDLAHFKVTLVRRVFWHVDGSWVEEFLHEAQISKLPLEDEFSGELEFIELLQQYRLGCAGAFRAAHPLNEEIHREIETYCLFGDQARLMNFIQSLYNRTDELLHACPVFENYHQVFLVLEWMLGEITPGVTGDVERPESVSRQARWLARRLEAHSVRGRNLARKKLFIAYRGMYGLVIALSSAISIYVFRRFGAFWGALTFLQLFIAPLAVLVEQGAAWRERKDLEIAREVYNKHWRPEIVNVMRMNYYDLRQLLVELDDLEPQDRFEAHGYLMSCMRSDYALRFLSFANHFIW